MSLAQTLQEDRRGLILSALVQVGGSRLTEGSLKSVLSEFGHLVSSDQVRTDLHWLDQQGLVRIETAGATWIIQLLEAGQDVAGGVPHPGVRRQAPRR